MKDKAGTFTVGFFALALLCVIGVGLSFVLARMRRQALAANITEAPPRGDGPFQPLGAKA